MRLRQGVPLLVALSLVLALVEAAPAVAAVPGNDADHPARAPLQPHLSAAQGILAAPRHLPDLAPAASSCEAVVQDGFRWVSAAVMANGLPIVAYTSRRSYVSGGDPDEDGWLHTRVAAYLSKSAIAKPAVLDDPTIVGRFNGYSNESSVDVATNGAGGLILVTFIDPVRYRFVVRRSTDLGRTWSPIQQIAGLGFADPYSSGSALHQLYYDDQSGLFHLAFVSGYLTSADGVVWSAVRSWGRLRVTNSSNPGQSRIARFFRTKAGTWIEYGNILNNNDEMDVIRYGSGVCDTLACFPTQVIELWEWPGDGSSVSPGQFVLHTPGAAFYLPASSTPDRIHLLFGATGLTGFRSIPTGHLLHWWSDDDGRTWQNERGPAGGHGFDTSIVGVADVETPVPEPPTGPLADIAGAWIPSFGEFLVWGVEGNNRNDAPGLDVSIFGDGARDQTRVLGGGGYKSCSNTAPTLVLPADQRVFLHDGLILDTRFDDPDSGDTWTITVDYGDGSQTETLGPLSDHSVHLVHRYAAPGDFTVTLDVTDSAGASVNGSFRVAVDLKRVILYVHGTTGDFTRNDFTVLRTPLEARYEIKNFRYYEDRGAAIAGDPQFTCDPQGQRTLPVFDAGAFTRYGFAPDPPDPGPGVCDSNDDLELNTVLLDGDIADLLTRFDRVTLIANSGGGGVVRGYLAYASAAGSASLDGVDLVVPLEGVQAGSYLAAAITGTGLLQSDRPIVSWARDRAFDLAKPSIFHDPRRPVLQDVLPQAPFQTFVDRAEAVPNGPHYVNVVGDLVINVHYFALFWEYRAPDEVGVGDFVMLPGFDDPTASAPLGGARFLPASIGRGRSSGQWLLRREFDVVVDSFSGSDPTTALTGGLAAAIRDPASHLGLGRMDEICVLAPSSAGPVPKRLHTALVDAISSLDRGVFDPARLGFGNLSRVNCP